MRHLLGGHFLSGGPYWFAAGNASTTELRGCCRIGPIAANRLLLLHGIRLFGLILSIALDFGASIGDFLRLQA